MHTIDDNAKTLKNIELSANVSAELIEQCLPAIKTEVQTATVEITAAVNSLRGVLQAILAALVVVAVILLIK